MAIRYTEEMNDFLRSFIPGHTESEIADAFENRFGIRLTRTQVKNKKLNLGVKSGTTGGRFKSGHTPWTKGKTWDEIMSPEAQERCRATQIKKGHNLGRVAPIGSEWVSEDGIKYRKVRNEGKRFDGFDGKWVSVANLTYAEAYGQVPDGYVVIHADRDSSNDDLSNLVAVDRRDYSVINRHLPYYYDRESLEVCISIARLMREKRKAQKCTKN